MEHLHQHNYRHPAKHHIHLSLEDSEHMLKSFYNSAPMMMGVVDVTPSDIIHIYDNEMAAQFFDDTPENMQGKSATELGMPQESIHEWLKFYHEALITHKPVHFDYWYAVGNEERHFTATVSFIGYGEHHYPRFSYIVQDTSHTKRTEGLLKKSRQFLEEKIRVATNELKVERDKLSAVISHVDIGIGLTDAKGKTLNMNPAGLRIHGFNSVEEMLSRIDQYADEFELQYADGKPMPREEWPICRAMNGDYVRNYDLRLLRKSDGTLKHLSYSVDPIRDAGNKVVYLVFDITDLTERKRVEEELHKSIKTRDEFMSIASHELKTPLTTLTLQAQAIKRMAEKGNTDAFAPERVDKFVNQIEKQVTRLSRLVDDMLDISKIGTGKLTIEREKFDMCALVSDVTERLKIQFTKAGSNPQLEFCEQALGYWDRFRMEQVMVNLLTNAIKYGSGKPIEVRIMHEGDDILVSIKDNGIGIARQNLERIFQRFERAVSASEVSGLGLGLFIAQQIIKAHGGRIWVESTLGHGSTFFVKIPKDYNSTHAEV